MAVTNQLIKRDQVLHFDGGDVGKITVAAGPVVFYDEAGEKTKVANDGDEVQLEAEGSLHVFAPRGGRFLVSGDVHDHGGGGPRPDNSTSPPDVQDVGIRSADAGTGPFESRNVNQLRNVARDRGVTGYASLKKDELIAALRGENSDADEAQEKAAKAKDK